MGDWTETEAGTITDDFKIVSKFTRLVAKVLQGESCRCLGKSRAQWFTYGAHWVELIAKDIVEQEAKIDTQMHLLRKSRHENHFQTIL